MTVITAQAIIKGKDDTGAAFGSVAAKLAQLERQLSLVKKASDQLAAIDRLKGEEAKLARLSTRYAEQRAAIDRAARAYEAAGGASAQLRAKLEQTERVMTRVSSSFYRQQDAVAGLKRHLSDSGVAVSRLASEETRLRAAVDASSAAIARQNALLREEERRQDRLSRMGRRVRHVAGEVTRDLGGRMVGAAGGAGGGYAGIRIMERAAETAAEREAALNRVRNVANSEDEVRLARDLGQRASGAYPYTTATQAIEDYVELRSLAVSNKPGEAINREAIERNVMLMARARAALASSGYKLEAGEAKSLAQAIEGSGRAMDPRAQGNMLEAFVRAKQVFGNAIQASSVRDFVANAKSSNFSLSDAAFFNTVMARLAQGNASRLGNEFAQTMNTIVGGHMTKQGAEWLATTGMIDRRQIRKGGGGKFYIAGKIKNQDLLSANPDIWALTELLPGIQKTGVLSDKALHARMNVLRAQELKANPKAQIDDHALEERALHGLIADYISKSGFRTTVTDNLAHAIANAFLTQKDVEQMKAAKGLGAADTIGQNPWASFVELTNSMSSFIGTLGSPAAQEAGQVMHRMAGGVAALTGSLSEWQKKNPELATGAGAAAAAGGAGLGVYAGYRAARAVRDWWRGGGVAPEAGAPGAAGGAGWLARLFPFGAGLSLGAMAYDGGADREWWTAAKARAATRGGDYWLGRAVRFAREGIGGVSGDTADILRAHAMMVDDRYGSAFSLSDAARRSGGFDLARAETLQGLPAALAELKAFVAETRKPVEVKVEQTGAVAVTLRALPGTEIVHTSSSGQVDVTRMGTSMPSLRPGVPPPT